jgi:hypothetical protein
MKCIEYFLVFFLKKILQTKSNLEIKMNKVLLKKKFMDKSEKPWLWLGINENLKSDEFLNYNLYSIRISSTRILCANNRCPT